MKGRKKRWFLKAVVKSPIAVLSILTLMLITLYGIGEWSYINVFLECEGIIVIKGVGTSGETLQNVENTKNVATFLEVWVNPSVLERVKAGAKVEWYIESTDERYEGQVPANVEWERRERQGTVQYRLEIPVGEEAKSITNGTVVQMKLFLGEEKVRERVFRDIF